MSNEENRNGGRARPAPYIYASWLAKALAGEIACQYQGWFKAHFTGYTKIPPEHDLARWVESHTQAVTILAERLRLQGNGVSLESENAFKYRTRHGVVIACKPDLISTAPGHPPMIVDVKTGYPRNSDSTQVRIYALLGPYACRGLRADQEVRAAVYYNSTATLVEVPAAPDPEFIARLDTLTRLFAAPDPPPTSPGSDCLRCDIAECEDRLDRVPEGWGPL
jgi:hypothetical protein